MLAVAALAAVVAAGNIGRAEPGSAKHGIAMHGEPALGPGFQSLRYVNAAAPKAMINNDTRGFVKIISDPATGVVLGGSIVGRHAAELISVIALAVTAGLRVTDIVDSLLVHPTVAEALADAAD